MSSIALSENVLSLLKIYHHVTVQLGIKHILKHHKQKHRNTHNLHILDNYIWKGIENWSIGHSVIDEIMNHLHNSSSGKVLFYALLLLCWWQYQLQFSNYVNVILVYKSAYSRERFLKRNWKSGHRYWSNWQNRRWPMRLSTLYSHWMIFNWGYQF